MSRATEEQIQRLERDAIRGYEAITMVHRADLRALLAERAELLKDRDRLHTFERAILDAGQPEEWELSDPRVSYVTVQIDKQDWLDMCAAIPPKSEEKR